MQSRTFLRIEGDLVSLVTEVIDREVTLPDLLTELTSSQVAISPRLPTGCRFWLRSGTTDRQVFVLEQQPSRRTIEYHACRLHGSEPTSYRLALPYVVFVVSTIGDQIEGLSTYFRTEPIGSLDATLFCSTLPNTSDDGIVCLGSVRVTGTSAGERIDALVGAFWASRFNQDLRRHPMPFSGGFRAWASRSRRDPLVALSMRYDPYWRTLRQVVASMAGVAPTDLPAASPEPEQPTETEVRTPEPEATDEGGEGCSRSSSLGRQEMARPCRPSSWLATGCTCASRRSSARARPKSSGSPI